MCRHMIVDWEEVVNLKRQVVKVKRGERFIKEGDVASGVYFVQEGVVKVHKRWGEKESIVRFAKKGDIVGHRGLSHAPSVFPISATAMESSVLCFVPIDFFKSLLKANPVLTYELLMFFADELQVSEQKVTNQVQLSVKGRLAWSLLKLEEKMGLDARGYIAISLSKADLAAYVGSAYESVHRMFAELQGEGIVEADSRSIKVLDRQKLMAYSHV